MRLSHSAAYAIHAAAVLARQAPGSTTPCGKIASEGHLPERFLLQILRALVKAGVLHSTRGGGGGFSLCRPPDEISLLEIIEAIDGPISAHLPPLGVQDGGASAERQTVERALGEVARRTRQHLATISLAELAPAPPPNPAPTAWLESYTACGAAPSPIPGSA